MSQENRPELEYRQRDTPDPKVDRDRRTIRLVLEFSGGLWCLLIAGPAGGYLWEPLLGSLSGFYPFLCMMFWFLGVRLLVTGRNTLNADRDGRLSEIIADRCVLIGLLLALMSMGWIVYLVQDR